ncbi:Putative kinase [Nitrosotalea devaniterrae]|uniref:Kinase n=1 Tax=Nitrosotalea devaniterrae TaxID=1078905 RepID=A0A128A0T8_9ARCH|nr:Putative kinase [Candidatus Nitrosotalea devanaterra]
MKSIIVRKEYLRKNYPQITPIKKIVKLRHIDLNSVNFLIYSKNGKYVLHFNTDKTLIKKIEDVCKILRFCSENAVKVSEPIIRKNGKFVDVTNNCYLTRYYEGHLYDGSVKELKELSSNIANLHKVLSTYPRRFNHTTDNKPYRILTRSELEKISKGICTKAKFSSIDKKVFRNISFITECIEKDISEAEIMNKIKSSKQLIHSDLHPKNVIFNNGKVSAIIDFNSLRIGEIEEDLAFASYRFASYKKRNVREIKNHVTNFIDTYKKYHPITKERTKLVCYFFRHITLQRLCYIIRTHYFKKSDLWMSDFDKHLNLLKLQNKIEILMKTH